MSNARADDFSNLSPRIDLAFAVHSLIEYKKEKGRETEIKIAPLSADTRRSLIILVICISVSNGPRIRREMTGDETNCTLLHVAII